MSDKLEPCFNPDCRSADGPRVVHKNTRPEMHWINCNACGVCGPEKVLRSEAVAKWNALPRRDDKPAEQSGDEAMLVQLAAGFAASLGSYTPRTLELQVLLVMAPAVYAKRMACEALDAIRARKKAGE